MSSNQPSKPYKVLATKYRPVDFDSLVGQDVLVRTLTNAINSNRIANAFVLTGIRGVGKTTTARIIARALNCVGEDGKGSETIKPCGVCSNCLSIMEDRHPDVVEMDAASRTGVDDVREVIENTHYMPIAARYKIYIIDEVHMLSKNAFNALLKTLEEPPSHVKFIFATTEIRKIPVTVLSRCMRFDLKRIETSKLVDHLAKIAKAENASVTREALAIIASGSEGSVRDSLSLLDQVIANAEGQEVGAKQVRDALGIADKGKVIELFNLLAEGDAKAAFVSFHDLYMGGGDPVLIFNDLLEFTYLVTRMHTTPDIIPVADIPEEELKAAKNIATKLDIPYLTRLWQVLLKGLEEIKISPNSLAAAEMILVRIIYMSELPSPAKIIRDMQNTQAPENNTNAENAENIASAVKEELPQRPSINSFAELVELFKNKGEVLLYNWLAGNVRPVIFEKGRVEIEVCDSVPKDFARDIEECLKNWTDERWVIIISKQNNGSPTLREEQQSAELAERENMKSNPEVSKVLEMFPGAVIEKVSG